MVNHLGRRTAVILLFLFLGQISVQADSVTIQFFLGEIPGLAEGTVGILVADSAGDGFESIHEPSSAGTLLTAGAPIGNSDDIIIATTQAQAEGFSNGVPGFGDTFGNIDYDEWALTQGLNLRFFFFPGITQPGTTLGAGQLYYSFDSGTTDSGGDIGYWLPSAPGVYTLSHLDLSHGGGQRIFPLNGTVGMTAQSQFQIKVIAAGLNGDQAQPEAIPFGDRVENLLKYAFNLDLSAPDSRRMVPEGSAGLPRGAALEQGDQHYWRVEFVRRKGSGLIYLPLKSNDLSTASWTGLNSTPVVTDIDTVWERVVYDEPFDPAATASCFVVVEVTLP